MEKKEIIICFNCRAKLTKNEIEKQTKEYKFFIHREPTAEEKRFFMCWSCNQEMEDHKSYYANFEE